MLVKRAWRTFVVASVLAGASLVWAPEAGADTVDIVVDSTEVTLEEQDDDTLEGKVTLANISDGNVTVEAGIDGDAGCSVTADPASVAAGRRTTVTLTAGTGCDVADGADITLTYGGAVSPASHTIVATAEEADEPDWHILRQAFVLSVALAAICVVWAIGRIKRGWVDAPEGGPAARDQEVAAKETLQAERNADLVATREARGLTAPGDLEVDVEPRELEWSTELVGLETGWSFSDSWASSVTVGTTVLVALLAASDVLEAVLGKKPEEALSLFVVASAIATALVAIAPLVLKAVGKKTSVPTIGGTLFAALLTLTGTGGQLAAVTLQARELVSGRAEDAVAVMGILVGLIVASYASRSLAELVLANVVSSPAPTPPEVRAAWIIAKAIRPELVRTELSPLDMDETLAAEESAGTPEQRLAALQYDLNWEAFEPKRRTALL